MTGVRLYAVVKADAYGHGAEEIVNALDGIADAFVVSIPDEAVAIRTAACGKDILVLTPPISESEILTFAQNGWIMTLPDLRTARLAERTCRKHGVTVRAHLKVNTGMNRYGSDIRTLGKICKFLQKSCVRVDGIYSHLYTCRREIAEMQRIAFERAVGVCRRYFPRAQAHLSATYGATLGKAFAFDAVRVGLGLYGYLPDGADGEAARLLGLKKAMRVEAEVAATRIYSNGGAGYGTARELKKGQRLTVCRFGYADGFLRRRENGTDGEERNVNTLCMDACIRVGKEKRGERVCVLRDADETARKTGTIAYEVLCAATRRAETVYDYKEFADTSGRRNGRGGAEKEITRVRKSQARGDRQP